MNMVSIIKSSNKFNFPNNITLENKYILTDQKMKKKEKGNNDENLVFVFHEW